MRGIQMHLLLTIMKEAYNQDDLTVDSSKSPCPKILINLTALDYSVFSLLSHEMDLII